MSSFEQQNHKNLINKLKKQIEKTSIS